MANVLTAYTPTIIGRTLRILREHLRIQRFVTRDYDSEMLNIGASLQIPVTAQLAASDIVPSSTQPPLVSITPSNVTLTLNQFKEARFSLTVADANTMMRNSDFVPTEMMEAARTIARAIIDYLWTITTQCPYYVGTAGTTPFATTLAALASAAYSLDTTLADTDGRVALFDNTAIQALRNLGNMIQYLQRGPSVDTLSTGVIGEVLGFQVERDSRVPSFTAGTAASYTFPVTPPAAGITSVAIITGTGTWAAGDIFTIAGDTTSTYVATNAGSAAGTLTFYPPLNNVPGASAAITFKATRRNNFAMDRGFMALAMRQPREIPGMLNTVTPMIDNQGPEATNMQFFMNEMPNAWGVTYSIGALYGASMLRPERGVIIAG